MLRNTEQAIGIATSTLDTWLEVQKWEELAGHHMEWFEGVVAVVAVLALLLVSHTGGTCY